MKKRAETLKAKLLTLFKNLSLRWKIFFIVLLKRRLSPTVFPHWLYHTVKDL